MPTPGKSLLGFLAQTAAVEYQQTYCVTPDPNDIAALTAEWQAARAKLGAAIPNAGHPSILPIPTTHAPYIQALIAQPWMAHALATNIAGATFALVEIEPLLAFQFSVDAARSNHHCSPFSNPPTLDEMLQACLPQNPTPDPVTTLKGSNSMLLTSRSLNFQSVEAGLINGGFVGMTVGFSLPLVHVVEFNGRHYLHNGFHRTFGARMAGATHIPCVLRSVPTPAAAGINPPGTFDQGLLESNDPPTVGHFTLGRAHDVQLRAFHRTMHVTWNEYVVPVE